MRIIVETSDYYLGSNVGDVAMTRIAVARLAALWPQASIELLADSPAALPLIRPGLAALALPEDHRTPASQAHRLWSAVMPLAVRQVLGRQHWLRQLTQWLPRKPAYAAGDLAALTGADLMVVAGMGGVTDAFTQWAFALLERIEHVLDAGAPVVMVGQGIGPLRDRRLRARAAAILPRVALILLREDRESEPLLRSLGVSTKRIMTTGDDAVELAFESRASASGTALGLNLRESEYANVDAALVGRFAAVVQDAARTLAAPIRPLPTDQNDVPTVSRLVDGYGEVMGDTTYLNDPIQVLERIKSCRVVITGSYHAAVFSLAMGIPALGITNSEYYVGKFQGLAALFGNGCAVVSLGAKDWPSQMTTTLRGLWQTGDKLRPQLLAAARHQVALGHAAYRMIPDSAGISGAQLDEHCSSKDGLRSAAASPRPACRQRR